MYGFHKVSKSDHSTVLHFIDTSRKTSPKSILACNSCLIFVVSQGRTTADFYPRIYSKDPARAQSRLETTEFPKPEQGTGRPLFEDYILRDHRFTESYYPEKWVSDAII